MTLISFFGCTFIAFGPALSMFIITVAPDAQQVIVFISSAFFWLLSLLTSSIWWTAVVPLKKDLAFSLFFSVLFQEIFRFAFWVLLRKAEDGLLNMTHSHSPLRKLRFHYVSGLGYGVMSGLFAMVNILADITGPGTVGLRGDYQHFVVISAFLANAMILLHTFWGIISFDALDKKNKKHLIAVFLSHLVFSGLTLTNKNQVYWPSLTVGYILVVVMAIWSFYSAGGSLDNLKRAFRKQTSPEDNVTPIH